MNATQKKFLETWNTPETSGAFAGMTGLDFLRDQVADQEAEYRSEVDAYGDAGPGAAVRLANAKAQLARIERTVKKLLTK